MVTPEFQRPGPRRQPEFTLIPEENYKSHLLGAISAAQRRVWVQTMTFDGGGFFPQFQQALIDAASPPRNVDTRFTTDMYFRRFLGDILLPERLTLSRSERHTERVIMAKKEQVLVDLSENNVQVAVTNFPRNIREKINMGRGRNHRKMVIVDDIAYVGDVHHFVTGSQPGSMIRITDPLLVNGLAELYERGEQGRGGRNYKIAGSDGSALLIDEGSPRSLILDTEKEAMRKAQRSITVTSQYTIDGEALTALQDAQDNGIKVKMIVADPTTIGVTDSKIFDTRSQLLYRRSRSTIPIYEVPEWIHPNILLIDEGLPSAQVFMGTRVCSDTIAGWGSQEVALQTQDPGFLRQTGEYLQYLQNIGGGTRLRNPNRSIREILFSTKK